MKATILEFQIFHAKAPMEFAGANQLPRDKALGAMARIFTSPKERAPLPINRGNESFVEPSSTHVVEGE